MKSSHVGIVLFIAIVFIAIGDKFLPGALGEASAKTRNGINNFLIGLVPSWEPSVDPHKRTEDAIKKGE